MFPAQLLYHSNSYTSYYPKHVIFEKFFTDADKLSLDIVNRDTVVDMVDTVQKWSRARLILMPCDRTTTQYFVFTYNFIHQSGFKPLIGLDHPSFLDVIYVLALFGEDTTISQQSMLVIEIRSPNQVRYYLLVSV